ncbi:MAG TPA: ABC transporter permease [Dehalococcoidia bacterium]|nr:ABC transporter permease [Dehalococcoidia bacterium]
MIGFIFGLTLRQLVFRKSTLLLLALATIPVLIAVIFEIGNDGETAPEEFAVEVLAVWLVTTTVLPLTSVLFGTSVLGDELEDGTIIYLLTKPVQRWLILLPKIAAAWLLTTALVVTSLLISVLIVMGGDGGSIMLGFGVAAAIGALAYAVVFTLLSIVTSRALIAGLIFVFIWEGAVTGIFEGVRYFSIRHYTLGIAEWVSDAPTDYLNAYVGGLTALILCGIVIVAGFAYANQRLRRVEIREAT